MKAIIPTLLACVSFISVASANFADPNAKRDEPTHATVGKIAPDFTLKTSKGVPIKLSHFLGNEVVLEWVNFQCPFVKKHYNKGHMQAIQKKYTEKGVVWLQISSANTEHPTYLDSAALEAASKQQKSKATYALVDSDGAIGKTYIAKTTPHMYVIDKKGVLAYSGAIDSTKSTETKDIEKSENYVTSALDSLLAGKEVKTAETKAYGCSVKY